jgi:hypothetical protein
VINVLIEWFRKFKKRQQEMMFRHGYDFAAGKLLRNPAIYTTRNLEHLVEGARFAGDFDYFDKGVEAALHDWEKINA